MFLLRPLVWIWVLLRHDGVPALGQMAPKSGPLRWLYAAGCWLGHSQAREDAQDPAKGAGKRLARALLALGPTFIKVGQIISTRADLLGDAVCQELSILHDQLPPAELKQVRAQLEASLEQGVDQAFSSFDWQPISAASVAQVHFAITDDGRPVAVKTLRPGIQRAFDRDLVPLAFWAGLAEAVVPPLRQLKPHALVKEFQKQVALELDLRLEAASMNEIDALHHDDPRMVVPRVDWERTTSNVLTMSRESGIPIDERQLLIDAGLDVEEVLTRAASLFFKGVFELGVFHGDQHAGNMFIKPDGRVLFVDFGIVGRVPRQTRFFLADMMRDLLERRYGDLAQRYADQGYLPADADVGQFATALRALAEPIMGQPLEKVSFATLLGNLLAMGRRFGLAIEPELFLLQKNMLMAEGIARSLEPRINIWTLAQPLITRWMWENRGPQAQLAEATRQTQQLIQKVPGLIESTQRTLAQIEKQQNQPAWQWGTMLKAAMVGALAIAGGLWLASLVS